MAIREFLRRRRAAKRIAADARADALLDSESGRRDYLKTLDAECAQSSLIALLEDALAVPGDIVECGVYRGASLRRIAKTVKAIAPEKTVFGLDSFEGFPEDGVSTSDSGPMRSVERLSGKFKDADDAPARIKHFADVFDYRVELKKGYFEDTLPSVSDRALCFLHIDCDTYAGHVEVLEALYDRIAPGGCIVFDDYDDPAWPGATKAVDEFFANRAEVVSLSQARDNPAWFVTKPRGDAASGA